MGAYLGTVHASSSMTPISPARLPLLPRDEHLGPEYAAGDGLLFPTYSDRCAVRAWVDDTFPRADGESDAARNRAVTAKALDSCRPLPPRRCPHMGIYATVPGYEHADPALVGHPLPEAPPLRRVILAASKAVMPKPFDARVRAAAPRRRRWVTFLENAARPASAGRPGWAGPAGTRTAARSIPPPPPPTPNPPLLHVAFCYASSSLRAALLCRLHPPSLLRSTVAALSDAERDQSISDLSSAIAPTARSPPFAAASRQPLPVRDRFDYGACLLCGPPRHRS